jgi:hypothetical protein
MSVSGNAPFDYICLCQHGDARKTVVDLIRAHVEYVDCLSE